MRDTSQDTCVQAQVHISCTFAALGWKSLLSSGYYMLSFLIINFQVEDLSEAIDVFANMRLACADWASFLSKIHRGLSDSDRTTNHMPKAADMSCVPQSSEERQPQGFTVAWYFDQAGLLGQSPSRDSLECHQCCLQLRRKHWVFGQVSCSLRSSVLMFLSFEVHRKRALLHCALVSPRVSGEWQTAPGDGRAREILSEHHTDVIAMNCKWTACVTECVTDVYPKWHMCLWVGHLKCTQILCGATS